MAGKKHTRHNNGLIWFMAAFCVLAAAVLVALLVLLPGLREKPVSMEIPQTEAAVSLAALPVTADGNPRSLRCKDDYLVHGEAFDPDAAVAKLGGQTLTAGQLQVYYWLEVCGYAGEIAPDLSVPLAEQPCPLTQEGLSWQHYFLRRAIASWQTQQALVLVSGEPMPVTEALFQPNAEDHAANFPTGIPAEKVLYADRDCFTPNSVHQEYLDSLPQLLLELAHAQGEASIGNLAGSREEDVLAVAERLNLAYMFFTEKTWEEAKAASQDADTVSLRSCLLIPATGEEEYCRERGEKLLSGWSGNWLTRRNSDSNFARLTNEYSQDPATKANGGLLTGVRQGQLIEPLDAWCFDPARQPGDTAILRSELGWHLVYFRGRQTKAAAESAEAALADRIASLLERAAAYGEARVDYSAVTLAPTTAAEISAGALLYPDVGFQRFPEVPLYLQQDYGDLRFGKQYLRIAGCGMCSMAMVATYMTDTVYTPAMMVQMFPHYYGEVGTDGNIFLYGPADLGFFSDGQLRQWEEILSRLQDGDPIVTLQIHGVFTTGGHFMVLSQGYDDGTVTVRDSNLNNYTKLEGYKTDRFTKEQILSGGVLYYAFQPKLVTLPCCIRCGQGNDTAQDYLCPKCAAALERREAFLRLTTGS